MRVFLPIHKLYLLCLVSSKSIIKFQLDLKMQSCALVK